MIARTMTVNHMVKTHPHTQAVFQAFKIDWVAEGDYFLDELCWYRGIKIEALLAALRQALRSEAEIGERQEVANVSG